MIFHGDPGDSLHLVMQGHIGIRIFTPLGDIATVRLVRQGEFFGELAVVAPGPRNATAVALDRCATVKVPRQQRETCESITGGSMRSSSPPSPLK